MENDVKNLETIAAKIFAIGELIKFRGGEPSLDEQKVNYGIGEILTDLAEELTSESTSNQSISLSYLEADETKQSFDSAEESKKRK